MRVLVTGASGFLGQAVVRALLARGDKVRAIVRPFSPIPQWDPQVEIVRADLRSVPSLSGVFAEVDSIVHLAAATSGGEDAQFASSVIATENLLAEMQRTTVRHMVLVSSLVVYDWHQTTGEMSEDSPLSSHIYDMGAYSIAKFWQEKVTREWASRNDCHLTVLRPGFIWGPGRAAIAGMGRLAGPFHLMFGPFTRLPLTFVDNCADCIVHALHRQSQAKEQVYNVVDSDHVRVWQYAREYNRRNGVRKRVLVPIPYYAGVAFAKLAEFTSQMLFGPTGRLPSLLMSRRYEAQFKPIRFSTKRVREEGGWIPKLDFEQCLSGTYDADIIGKPVARFS